jgi:hypothetical protein
MKSCIDFLSRHSIRGLGESCTWSSLFLKLRGKAITKEANLGNLGKWRKAYA